MKKTIFILFGILILSLVLVACDNGDDNSDDNNANDTSTSTNNESNGGNNGNTGQSGESTELPPLVPPDGEMVRVVRVIDGDTIDIAWHDDVIRVRYIGVNTPERNEVCFDDATQANASLVDGQIVRLFSDTSETDQFDRLLRYVYLGNTHVNALLVELGYAEVVSYPPDTMDFDEFRDLEQQAAADRLGCHPTGIFDDGTYER
jgi:micrococcal nuclease